MNNDNGEQLVHEALRLAELNLASELSLMLAADQRATTFSGMIVAALAVVATIYDHDTANWTDDLGLLILAFAAGLALYSVRSVKIIVPGVKFDNFADDIKSHRDVKTVLTELGRIYDAASTVNRKVISRNAKFYNAALIWTIAAFVVALIPNAFSLLSRLVGFLANEVGVLQ